MTVEQDDDELVRAEVRLARASDAWLTSVEEFEKIKAEYQAALQAVLDLQVAHAQQRRASVLRGAGKA